MLKNMFLRGEVEGWSLNRRTGICYFRQVLTGEQECSGAHEFLFWQRENYIFNSSTGIYILDRGTGETGGFANFSLNEVRTGRDCRKLSPA